MTARKERPRIQGRYRLTSTELWDSDALDLLEPAFIRFEGENAGEFRMIAIEGGLDCRHGTRDGRPAVEFSWAGMDELDEVSGRGWAVLEEDGTLSGRLFFHQGDDSAFIAEPEGAQGAGVSGKVSRAKSRPRPRK
ncbi:hypothetical protein ACLESO_04120 [Pyxidicoccus sp. 3LG]